MYDGDAVERSTTAIQDEVQNRGYAFVEVRPRIARNKAKQTVDLVFDVTEGSARLSSSASTSSATPGPRTR